MILQQHQNHLSRLGSFYLHLFLFPILVHLVQLMLKYRHLLYAQLVILHLLEFPVVNIN